MVARIPTIIHNGTTNITPTFHDPVTTYIIDPGITPQGGKYNGGVFSYYTTTDTVNASVIGQGLYNVNSGGVLEFLHDVGTGQKVELNGSVTPVALRLDDPAEFHGHVDMNYQMPSGFFLKSPPGTEQISVAMQMIGRAVDSWSYHSENHADILQLWSGKRVVESLGLTVKALGPNTNDPYGFTVQRAPGGWIYVSANDRSHHGLDFLNNLHLPALPVHV